MYTFSQVGRLPGPAVGAVDGLVLLKMAEGVREVEAGVAGVAVGYTSRTHDEISLFKRLKLKG